MRERIDTVWGILQDFWSTYSIYIMIPVSVAAFVIALYFMLHDVM
jgi:hypothetical protein